MGEFQVKGCNCVSNATVYGLYESIGRAKYPMLTDISHVNCQLTKGIASLANSAKGEGHDNWLQGIIVQFDLTFTIKCWTEAERYHFFDFISSQSTMHRITKFDLDKQYCQYVDPRIVDIMKEKIANYNELLEVDVAKDTINGKAIEDARKIAYLEILYSNPCGFTLTAGMTTNYRQLKTIYSQRKNHKLPEWREFCKWIETLPMSELITGKWESATLVSSIESQSE